MVTTMDMHRLVGRRVAEARDRRGLSQAELGESMAQLLGEGKAWSNKVVSFVETGQRQLDSSELLIVAACLDVPVYQLLTPRPDEAVELPSGDLMDSAEVTRHVVGDARTDPRLATVAGRMEVLAEVADELAGHGRAAASK
jgi:transcriptional regulator with XRE-family HTH domain